MTGPSDVDVATEEPETFAETLSAPMEHETFARLRGAVVAGRTRG